MDDARRLAAVLAVSVCALTAASANTFTEEYTASVPLQPAPWDTMVTLPRFAPATGDLQRIDFELTVQYTGLVQVENENAVPALFSYQLGWETFWGVSLDTPLGLGLDDVRALSGRLSAYDGETDFGGASGAELTYDFMRQIADGTSDAALLSEYIGDEPITLPIMTATDIFMNGTRPLVWNIELQAAAEVRIVYTYVPEPAGVWLLALAGLMMARGRR